MTSVDRPLTVQHMGLVYKIARSYARGCRHLTFEDLVSEGFLGLMRAAELFDPARGFAFSTFAVHWIRQGCTRAIANKERCIRIPVWRLAANNAAGVSNAERTVSLDAPVGDTDEDKTWHDVFAAAEPGAPEFERSELAAVGAAVDQLPERAAAVVRGRLQGLTLRQVGEDLGVSRERARQLERDALDTIRRRLRVGSGPRAA